MANKAIAEAEEVAETPMDRVSQEKQDAIALRTPPGLGGAGGVKEALRTPPGLGGAGGVKENELVVEADDREEEELEGWKGDRPQSGGKWGGVVLGIGIGIAIALGGMRLMASQNPKSVPQGQPQANLANAAKPAAPSQTVTVAQVKTGKVARTLSATGTVAAYDMLQVLPQANGLKIQQVLVEEGEVVEAGQVMAILDDSVLRSQIDQAQAQAQAAQATVLQKQADQGKAKASVAQAQASLSEAYANLTQEQASLVQTETTLVEAQANLAQANANLAQAIRERDRYQSLADQGAVSIQEVETRTTAAETAREGVRVAEARVRSAEANISRAKANITQAEARVSSSEANLNSTQASVSSAEANVSGAIADVRNSKARVEQQQTQLEQTLVRAPKSGIVAEKIASVGDVTGGKALFSIIGNGQLELEVKVPETQLPQVRIGTPVKIASDADSRIKVEGTVREIAPLVDEKSRQAKVKINLPGNNLLKPGMFLRAAITTDSATAMTVPAKAVQPQADGRKIVYVLQAEDKVKAQPVEVGEILEGGGADLSRAIVEIKSGVKPGDRVVVAGAGYVKDGDKVKVVPDDSVTPNAQQL